MNLFWKNLFAKITPTIKLEKTESEILNAMHRYDEVAKSRELNEYNELYHEVKSAAFIENKKTLKNRKYKDTETYRDAMKLRKLEDSKDIKQYYEILKSRELEKFLSFKSSSEFEDLGNKQKVKNSEKLQEYKKYANSKAYKIYTRFNNSYIIKEFEELKTTSKTPEFNEKNEFWSNSNRWETTKEHKKEERFFELAKNPDIVFYNNEKPERFIPYRNITMSFQDEFSWNTLDKSRWDYGFHYKNEKLIGCHSFANEKQANNRGKNTSVENGILKISTEHETIKAPAWHPSKGFITKEFEYSSDVLQTSNEFRQKYGIFRAKIRCTGNINHAFWLGSDNKLPHINIFHFDGKYIKIGNAGKNVFDGVKISGINTSNFYIYTLKWTEKELIWLINDFEVYRTTSNIPKEEMYLVFNSFISENQKGDTGKLEVDWVRVYK